MPRRLLLVFTLASLFWHRGLLRAQPMVCQPGDVVCGEVQAGPFQGRIRIGVGAPPPPPPVVVTPPTPPVVVVPQVPPAVVVPPPPPPPPPVVVAPPPPPPVVVAPPPRPPTVIVAPPPRTVIVTQPRPVVVRQRAVIISAFDTAFRLSLSGMFTDRIAIGGGNASFRLRPIEHLAFDLSAGFYAGEDYQKATRWEIPLIADLLFFINPYDRIQFYGLVGIGASIGQQGNYSRRGRFLPERGLVYIGGEVGLGVEWRWTRHFAVHFDVRAFLREQVGSSGPEFAEFDGRALRTTNTSAGVYGNLGLTLYFAGL